MEIIEVKYRHDSLIHQLVDVWERVVKDTHLFLSVQEIENIKQYVPEAIKNVAHLIIVENDLGKPIAFMGIENQRLEMLFIDERGKGIGKKLFLYGKKHYDINEVTVNEQNPQAIGFYEHMGFEVYKRTDKDEEGNPYPLLYMRLGG